MKKAWNQTRVSAALRIKYPIIQGPLGGFTSQKLAAGVSNFGGLGSFGAHGLDPSAIADVIAEIRSLTTKPFAINLWVSMEDEGARTSGESAFRRAASRLAPLIAETGGTLPVFTPYQPLRFEDRFAFCSMRECRCFPSSTAYHQQNFSSKQGGRILSRSERLRLRTRRRRSKMPVSTSLSRPDSRLEVTEVLSSDLRKIHSLAQSLLFHKPLMPSESRS